MSTVDTIYGVIALALILGVLALQVWWARRVLKLLTVIAKSTPEGREQLQAMDFPQPAMPAGFTPAPRPPRRGPGSSK